MILMALLIYMHIHIHRVGTRFFVVALLRLRTSAPLAYSMTAEKLCPNEEDTYKRIV